ncbi:DNA ligase [Marinobacter subterrani]|uniref:DNA ligase OB-like domain/ATP dependent DNA ligase domain n=1 Tax=Marinobacter subterrani TaxID=1658765 RepID=A0A0J7JFN9_9GAMM|nr:DNA ligase [Marinobacter subterrani]KMQ76739.1 DNA ligase OB-like domain/ATP dependent DNA ligase domain [Marinobacter subterrani]
MTFRLLSTALPVLVSLLFSAVAAAKPPELTLAKVYQKGMPLEGYWVSEKFDGVRAYWTGNRLISRGGHEYRAPAWFTRGFPEHPLDGELWMGRGRFAELSGAVRKLVPVDQEWRKIRFMVFDFPVSGMPFDQRLLRLQATVARVGSPFLAVVRQQRATTHEALMARLDAIVRAGAEGLMLRRGSSVYHAGRSDDLLKVKHYRDAEAVVIRQLPGEGKYEGMMGSLLVELENGRRFRIGSGFSDAERASPPEIGAVITFKYYGHTATGLPRFASFLRVRDDEPPR